MGGNDTWLLALLIGNVIHGGVALVWALGLRRFAGPVSVNLWTDLLSLSLVLPAIMGLWHLFGLPLPPDGWALVRTDLWVEALISSVAATAVWLALLVGTTVLFVVQEALPAWRWRHGRLSAEHVRDERLDEALEGVLAMYRARGPRVRLGRRLRVARLETDRLVAALQGLWNPTVVVSRGLLGKLDDDELDAVVAHELAHLARGGNLRTLGIWFLRALQAPSPAALVISRSLFESQEAACDAIAARVTGRPAVLADALLNVYSARRPSVEPGATALQRARNEVIWRSDLAATKIRVRSLLDRPPSSTATRRGIGAATVVLALLLWVIH